MFWFVCNVLKADIVNRGYGGYNTRWALFLLHHLFPLVSFFFFSSLGHCSCSSFRLCFVHQGFNYCFETSNGVSDILTNVNTFIHTWWSGNGFLFIHVLMLVIVYIEIKKKKKICEFMNQCGNGWERERESNVGYNTCRSSKWAIAQLAFFLS